METSMTDEQDVKRTFISASRLTFALLWVTLLLIAGAGATCVYTCATMPPETTEDHCRSWAEDRTKHCIIQVDELAAELEQPARDHCLEMHPRILRECLNPNALAESGTTGTEVLK